MTIKDIANIKFITPAHRGYEYILDFVIATCSFGVCFKVYHGLPATTFAPTIQTDGRLMYPSMLFSGIASKRHVDFIPHELFVDVLINNTRASQIPYVEKSTYADTVGVTTDAGAMFDGFTNAMFIRYYEDNIESWKITHGDQQDRWSEILRFARIVRNCMGHGGKIAIRNPKERPVAHFGLTYSYADNGKSIRSDMGPADIFYLMLDMDLGSS